MKRFSDKIAAVLSVETIKMALMKTAYGTQDTFLAKLDSRILIIWYISFAIIPWFFHNKTILLGLFIFMLIITFISHVSNLIIFLLSMSIVTELGSMVVVAYILGSGMEVFLPLLILTMKLTTIALASIAVFTSMDPEKFSDALLSFGIAGRYSFGVSYAYRILPVLFEEYNNIFNSFRLRGKTPDNKGILGYRYVFYLIKIAILAFYPMILNTAKRTRTTVEALELKGFTYALDKPKVKKLKLAYMKIGKRDILFLIVSILIVVVIILTGKNYPL